MHALTRALPLPCGPVCGLRCFGRPMMSVWGHAGAGSPSSKVACISFLRPVLVPIWCFGFDFSVSDAVGVAVASVCTLHVVMYHSARAHAHRLEGRLRLQAPLAPRSTQVLSTRSLGLLNFASEVGRIHGAIGPAHTCRGTNSRKVGRTGSFAEGRQFR